MTAALYLGAVGFAAGASFRIARLKKKRVPYLTLAFCALLGACLLLQELYPNLLRMFERDAAAIFAGEWWRLATALFFQDGGVYGGVSNIFFLGLIGALAEQAWSRKHWLLLYAGTGVAAELVALAWQPVGAGNSVAVFGLAAGICAASFASKADEPARALAATSAACACALLTLRDIHGAAFLIGLCLSATLLALANYSSEK